jgi:hypothetical protein
MQKYIKVGCVVTLAHLSAMDSSWAAVTASDALVIGKKLCAPLVLYAITPVHWSVVMSDGHTNLPVAAGDYWRVDGQYYPKTKPGIISVMDVYIYVPRNGDTPAPCYGMTN